MKSLATILMTCLLGCTSLQPRHGQTTNSQRVKAAKAQASPSSYPLSHAKDAGNVPSRIALCAEDEPGEKMVISGTVYEEDCATPVPGAVLYLYQTDVRGVYSDEKENGNYLPCFEASDSWFS